MGHDWYCVSTIICQGVLFHSRYISPANRYKYKLLLIHLPIASYHDAEFRHPNVEQNFAAFEPVTVTFDDWERYQPRDKVQFWYIATTAAPKIISALDLFGPYNIECQKATIEVVSKTVGYEETPASHETLKMIFRFRGDCATGKEQIFVITTSNFYCIEMPPTERKIHTTRSEEEDKGAQEELENDLCNDGTWISANDSSAKNEPRKRKKRRRTRKTKAISA